jgi:hypothetical protein
MFQSPRSQLNAEALLNMLPISVTLAVFQVLRSDLKMEDPSNMPLMLVALAVFQADTLRLKEFAR